MRLILAGALAVALGWTEAAIAQHAGKHQPYSELEDRAIKALSTEQVADLRAGRGMGLALAAELNGYPGPVHVLELADKLDLSAEQLARVRELHAAMQRDAVPLGQRLISLEADLDQQFASRSVTPASLAEQTAAIGTVQGALRAAHLKYHLSTAEVLTPAQTERYAVLRGYRSGDGREHDHGGHGQGSAP